MVLTNAYDGLGRLTGRFAGSTNLESWAYSPSGQTIGMTNAAGSFALGYDARDRLLAKSGPAGALTYRYDAAGHLTNLYSATAYGASLYYQYDALGWLTNVVDNRLSGAKNTAYTYDRAGNLTGLKYPNGVTNAWQYDGRHRLTNLVWNLNASPLAGFAYQLEPAGHRTNLTETVNGIARAYGWAFDRGYRLTNEAISGAAPAGALSYRYDRVGNRTNRTSSLAGVGATNNFFDANDWLDADSLTNNGSAWFDAAGNTRTNGATPYQYDWAHRLTNAGAGAVVLAYDPEGNRVKKVAGGVTILYLVDDRNPSGYAQVLEERTVSGSTTNLARQYTYGLDLISQRAPNVATKFYGYDGLGSARFLLDLAGAVTDTYAYDAYGSLLAATGATTNYYRYTGEQWDPELGLYYLRARYYQPNAGRSQACPPQASLDAPSRPASFGARGSRLSASPARWPTGFPAEFHFPVTARHVWSSWVIRKDFGVRVYGIDFKNQWDKDISNEAHVIRHDSTRGGGVRRPGEFANSHSQIRRRPSHLALPRSARLHWFWS